MSPQIPANEYCSTSEAAQRLGLSLGTVQQMVENGVLEGWKTAGGHRRILLTSLERFITQAQTGHRPNHASRQSGLLKIIIAEDDLTLQKLYEHSIESWKLPIELKIVSNGFDVLLEIGREAPDLLITDLRMPGLDGFEMIRRIRENDMASNMDIIAVSGLSVDEIEQAGGLPDDVTLYGKPVPLKELNGYAQALVARIKRESRLPA